MLAPTHGERISSRNTFFMKRVFPVMWFGFLAVFVALAVATARHVPKAPPAYIAFVVPVLMMFFGYYLLRRLVFDLADEVYDEGDALRVRFGSEAERIPLSNIANISFAGLTNPPRATLTLRQPGRFGKEVTFSPIQKVFGPLLRTSNPIVTDLIERVDAARRQ
ncbi:MAG TPA: hypothetical protein VL994_01440 [Steroidobacteraceae bacterium]|nr:hypothetical protein [Steroidobacteraceae bacterium]